MELLGFVALPAFLYAIAVREKNLKLAKWTAVLTVLGIILNRFNTSLVAFNWQLAPADRYFPSWMEIAISDLPGYPGTPGLPLHRQPDAHILRRSALSGSTPSMKVRKKKGRNSSNTNSIATPKPLGTEE